VRPGEHGADADPRVVGSGLAGTDARTRERGVVVARHPVDDSPLARLDGAVERAFRPSERDLDGRVQPEPDTDGTAHRDPDTDGRPDATTDADGDPETDLDARPDAVVRCGQDRRVRILAGRPDREGRDDGHVVERGRRGSHRHRGRRGLR
jgi:hypothetical protein